MSSHVRKVSNPFWVILFRTFICLSIIGGIIIGSYGLSKYLNAINDEDLFRPWETTCYVFDYELIEHKCESCGEDGCTIYKCYNQIYKITYKIFNNTYINSTIIINNKQYEKEQIKVKIISFFRILNFF